MFLKIPPTVFVLLYVGLFISPMPIAIMLGGEGILPIAIFVFCVCALLSLNLGWSIDVFSAFCRGKKRKNERIYKGVLYVVLMLMIASLIYVFPNASPSSTTEEVLFYSFELSILLYFLILFLAAHQFSWLEKGSKPSPKEIFANFERFFYLPFNIHELHKTLVEKQRELDEPVQA